RASRPCGDRSEPQAGRPVVVWRGRGRAAERGGLLVGVHCAAGARGGEVRSQGLGTAGCQVESRKGYPCKQACTRINLRLSIGTDRSAFSLSVAVLHEIQK